MNIPLVNRVAERINFIKAKKKKKGTTTRYRKIHIHRTLDNPHLKGIKPLLSEKPAPKQFDANLTLLLLSDKTITQSLELYLILENQPRRLL